MRAFLAVAMAVLVALVAAAPHVHTGPDGGHACVACLTRNAEEAQSALPDLAPCSWVAEVEAAAPGLPPVSGAPLGAVPGQSPPRA